MRSVRNSMFEVQIFPISSVGTFFHWWKKIEKKKNETRVHSVLDIALHHMQNSAVYKL